MTKRQKDLIEAEIKRHRALARLDPERLDVANALQICYINAIRWEVMECRGYRSSERKSVSSPVVSKIKSLPARVAKFLRGH